MAAHQLIDGTRKGALSFPVVRLASMQRRSPSPDELLLDAQLVDGCQTGVDLLLQVSASLVHAVPILMVPAARECSTAALATGPLCLQRTLARLNRQAKGGKTASCRAVKLAILLRLSRWCLGGHP